MESEWRVRAEYAFMPRPVYQVYRLKDREKPDVLCNREVAENVNTKEYAEVIAKKRNLYEVEHFWKK